MEFRYKVLVIDDDSSVSFYIKSVLEAQGYDVIVAENGRDSEIFASSHCPDIILLDLGLPDMDGVAVLKKIREWSAVPGDRCVIPPTGAGQGTRPRKRSRRLCTETIQHAGASRTDQGSAPHSRNSGTNLSIARDSRFEVGGLVIDYAKYRVYVDGNDVELTQNEYRLVALLGQYAGTVLTYADLIRRMWGPNAKQDNQILRVNMANIRRKIEKDPAHPRYIFTETGIGYRMADK